MAAENNLLEQIQAALADFSRRPLRDASTALLGTLGYQSDRTLNVGKSSPRAFLELMAGQPSLTNFDEGKALVSEWKTADLLFQLTDQELSRVASLFADETVNASLLKSYVFIAIELKGSEYARGKFSAIARQINRLFPMPVMVFFRHQERLTIAVINRRLNKRDDNKDVLGKVTLISGIDLSSPHRGHLDILASLALPNLVHPQKKPITDFDTLHAAWEQIFNIELLNARFYKELANWYFWALPQVEFPADLEPDDEKRRATGLIRLLTRLVFCWFLKEKGLIPEKLFHPADLNKILKGFDPESETSSTYYLAILQNLFFATLNQRMGKDAKGQPYRGFAKDEGFLKNRATYDINNLYRYESLFREEPEAALAHFQDIPFLNGGLFECLDRTEDGTDKKRYIDGFSRNAKKRPVVPDRLFFDSGETADLSAIYDDKKRKAEKVTGLINILNRYKFTIVENTPIDQEIALDPELLGKVFENLLASYNEETKTTARKQTGSFYTPRPIVDYMVDESLKAHLTRILVEKAGVAEADARAGLDLLFTYTEKEHAFNANEVACLIAAIDSLKILDPGCGSGAFPMGVLHKLVYILGKLDPDNERWKETQLAKLDSAPMRKDLARAFEDNDDDYGRKLYLIENCLYGVDIQPIAIQITKLRFFISLVCDQKTNRNKKENHGIRPLPNLETKFVAANTLVGLPEMGQLALVPQRVYAIEQEIELLHHSHFVVQRRDQKLAVQQKIKALRIELGKLLAESLMAPKKAQHVADWDPFDPQACSDFFDPPWMFGRALTGGFDLVIGNPPYRIVKDSDEKRLYDKLFIHQDYQKDLYLLFCERAVSLLKPNGVLSFITPNTWLASVTYKKIRIFLRSSFCWKKVFVPKNRVFTAIVDTIVFVFQRGEMTPGYQIPVEISEEDETTNLRVDEQYIPKDGSAINIAIPDNIHQLYRRILAQSQRVSEVFHVYNGVKPFEKGKGTPPQTAEIMLKQPYVVDGPKPNGAAWLPLLRGSLIERYKIRWESNYWIKYGPWLAAPRDKEIFSKGEKIYLRQTGDSIVAAYVYEEFIARNNLHLLLPKNKAVDVFACLGVLNSSLTGFIYSYMNPEKGEALAEVKKQHVEDLLMPVALAEKGKTISALTRLLVIDRSSADGAAGVSNFLYDLIDACVMECYFHDHMAERNLLFVDTLGPYLAAFSPDSNAVHQRNFLTNFYEGLNSPSHPIRNRLLRLTSDSPDLLAVIKQRGGE